MPFTLSGEFMPPPLVQPPHLIECMLKYPELTRFLECLVSAPHLQVSLGNGEWYKDTDLLIMGRKVGIFDLASCDPCKVRVILAHFPDMEIGARLSGDRGSRSRPGAFSVTAAERAVLDTIALCTANPITLAWVAPEGYRLVASYPRDMVAPPRVSAAC